MSVLNKQKGLTLTEVLVSLMLLALVTVPAINALHTGIVGSAVHADLADNHFRITSKMEQLLSEPFASLADAATAAGGETNPSSYSEAAGPPGRLVVYLAFYDGDNADGDGLPFTGGDLDLLWIRVEAEGTVHAIETIQARGM